MTSFLTRALRGSARLTVLACLFSACEATAPRGALSLRGVHFAASVPAGSVSRLSALGTVIAVTQCAHTVFVETTVSATILTTIPGVDFVSRDFEPADSTWFETWGYFPAPSVQADSIAMTTVGPVLAMIPQDGAIEVHAYARDLAGLDSVPRVQACNVVIASANCPLAGGQGQAA